MKGRLGGGGISGSLRYDTQSSYLVNPSSSGTAGGCGFFKLLVCSLGKLSSFATGGGVGSGAGAGAGAVAATGATSDITAFSSRGGEGGGSGPGNVKHWIVKRKVLLVWSNYITSYNIALAGVKKLFSWLSTWSINLKANFHF